MCPWHIDQVVCVEPRTWAGINRPGGVGKIVKIHQEDDFVQSVDVKYTVGGGIDQQLDLDFVKPYVELERQCRSRRTRDFFQPSPVKQRARGERNHNDEQNHDGQAKTQQTNKEKAASEKCTSRTTQRQTEAETQTVAKSEATEWEVPTTVSFAAEECSVSPLPQTPNEIRHLQLAQAQLQQQSKPETAKRSLAMASSGGGQQKKTASKPRKKKAKAPPKKPMDPEEMCRLLKGSSSAAKKPDHQPKWKQATLTSLMQPVVTTKKPPPTSSSSSAQQQSSAAQLKRPATGQKTQAIAEAIMGKKAAEAASAVRPRASVETADKDRVPLKQVYRNQMERASDFVNDVVGKPTADHIHDDESLASVMAEAAALLFEPQQPAASEPPIESSRLTLFTDILGNILMRRPELRITDVLEQVNGDTKMQTTTTPPFTNEERDACLEHLNDKDTVMISDGMIFSLL